MVLRLRQLFGLLLVPALACGGGADKEAFFVTPAAPVLAAGEHLQLTAEANVDLAGNLEWEVQEQYGGGLLRSQGSTVTYVAPEAAGVYHLVLRAPAVDGRKLKQTLTVRVVGSCTLEPSNARVAQGGNVSFTAHGKGLPKNLWRWSVQESGGGEISEEGRYTAPARPGTYHVLVASAADPNVSSQATVIVE